MQIRKNVSTKQLAVNGVMVALFIVLETVAVRIGGNIKITFSGLPIIISAVYFGPLVAGIVGGLGSFISQILGFGISPLILLWVLPAIVRGVTVGALYKKFGRKYLSVYIIFSSIIVSALNTFTIYFNSKIYNYYNPVTFLSATAFRFVSGIITAIVYVAIIHVILKALDKILNVNI